MKLTMTDAEVMAGRAAHLFRAYLTYYPDNPLRLARGQGQYLFDADGRKFLDVFGSVVTVSAGHCHPDVVGAAVEQMGTLQHTTTLYPEECLVRAARKLTSVTPEGLNKVFFTNSGSEANDFAAHAVRRATKRTGLVAMLHSFHGRTGIGSALTFQQSWRNVPPYAGDIYPAPNPYAFRRPKGMSEDAFYQWCLDQNKQVILHACGGSNLAGYWAELWQGNGGGIGAPAWYWDELIRFVHSVGGLFVCDEVQTGVGRTGKWWGCDWLTETPDMAKGLGNGHPVGAVVATEAISDAFAGLAHFNTHGGNAVSMAIVEAVLDVIDRDETRGNIHARGRQISRRLEELMAVHPMVVDRRGQGLIQFAEIGNPRDNSPAPEAVQTLMSKCRDRGFLQGIGGVNKNVFRITPPYCTTEADVDEFFGAFDESLTEVERTAA